MCSHSLCAKKFIESCKLLKKDQIIGRTKILMDLICNEPVNDGIFDDFFSRHIWTKQCVKNLMDEILHIVKLDNLSNELHDSLSAVFYVITKKKNRAMTFDDITGCVDKSLG